ncbi:hypothetical protein N0B31_05325 [Salinirubellus salinus]|uniref:Uncharacterized protein n=1 Tax=Salinirubellus salinus TaxID=1364945 RepID=A0A9E7R591_9EURY|nr:hypothetical protein [Salinirubellus salinus]UWM55706.1 hypothetical protein N0B31_05325 [Salinirubellus salinus]
MTRSTSPPARTDVAVFPEHDLTGFAADERVVDVTLARGIVAIPEG